MFPEMWAYTLPSRVWEVLVSHWQSEQYPTNRVLMPHLNARPIFDEALWLFYWLSPLDQRIK